MSRGMKIGLIVGGDRWPSRRRSSPTGSTRRRTPAPRSGWRRSTRRDLVSAVTASGKIEAKTSVDISADITGRIIRIAVREGDLVTKGQFLIQIDPAQYQAAVSRAQGVVSSTQATLTQTRANLDQAERAWNRARQLSQLGPNLIAPEAAEQAQTVVRRGPGHLSGDPRPAGAVAGEPAGSPGQPGQDPAHLADLGSGGAAGRGARRGGGARDLLAGDRPAHDDRRPLGDPGQGSGGRDRRGAARRRTTRSRSPSTPIPTPPSSGRVTEISHSAKLTADADGLRLQRPGGGLRRGGDARQSAARHPAGPELHRAHGDRHAGQRAQHPDHRAHGAGPRAGAQRESATCDTTKLKRLGKEAEGRVRRARRARHVPAGQGRHRGRRVLRGDRRAARGRDHRRGHLPGHSRPQGRRPRPPGRHDQDEEGRPSHDRRHPHPGADPRLPDGRGAHPGAPRA